jgi:hypothetical protein
MSQPHTGSTPGALRDDKLKLTRNTLNRVATVLGKSVDDTDARREILTALTNRKVPERNSLEALQEFVLSLHEEQIILGVEKPICLISKELAVQLIFELSQGRIAAERLTGQEVMPLKASNIAFPSQPDQGRQVGTNLTPHLCGLATQSCACKATSVMPRAHLIRAKLQEIGKAADVGGHLWHEDRSTTIAEFNRKFSTRWQHVCLAHPPCCR